MLDRGSFVISYRTFLMEFNFVKKRKKKATISFHSNEDNCGLIVASRICCRWEKCSIYPSSMCLSINKRSVWDRFKTLDSRWTNDSEASEVSHICQLHRGRRTCVSQRSQLQRSLLNRLSHHLRQLLLQRGSKVQRRRHLPGVQADPGGEGFVLRRCGQVGCSLKEHGQSKAKRHSLRLVKGEIFFPPAVECSSHLQKGHRLRLSQQTADVFLSFAHTLNVPKETSSWKWEAWNCYSPARGPLPSDRHTPLGPTSLEFPGIPLKLPSSSREPIPTGRSFKKEAMWMNKVLSKNNNSVHIRWGNLKLILQFHSFS